MGLGPVIADEQHQLTSPVSTCTDEPFEETWTP
jgi:hypothetical protein